MFGVLGKAFVRYISSVVSVPPSEMSPVMGSTRQGAILELGEIFLWTAGVSSTSCVVRAVSAVWVFAAVRQFNSCILASFGCADTLS